MSDSTKLSLLDVNYPFVSHDYRYKVCHDYRLFAYLFDNCSNDVSIRKIIGERVMDDIDVREEK